MNIQKSFSPTVFTSLLLLLIFSPLLFALDSSYPCPESIFNFCINVGEDFGEILLFLWCIFLIPIYIYIAGKLNQQVQSEKLMLIAISILMYTCSTFFLIGGHAVGMGQLAVVPFWAIAFILGIAGFIKYKLNKITSPPRITYFLIALLIL